jgi:sigma-B regulation protein RsbU (phosphoserine phosphatase)
MEAMEKAGSKGPGIRQEPEDRVQETVIDFGDFKVRERRWGNLTIFGFIGQAGPRFVRELESLTGRCRGDVGLDLSSLEGLSPAHVPALEKVRKRSAQMRHGLFLCNPPSRLRDLLNLNGISHLYPTAGEAENRVAAAEIDEQDAPRTATEMVRREIARFDRSIKRAEQIEQNLVSAARCVQKILPSREPVLPGYRFAFAYRQSAVVGGDFFDFIDLGDDRIGISIGDVSGNGLEAAVLMGLAKKVIAIRARDGAGPSEAAAGKPASPREVLARANEDLRGDLDRSTFITALYGILDGRTGTFRFSRAGHELPIWFAPGTTAEPRPVQSRGAALGVLDGPPFRARIEEKMVDLRPGEALLLFTDGVVDARSPRGQSFSRTRLREVLRRTPQDRTPGEVIDNLLQEVSRHSGGDPLGDDVTALLISRDNTGGAQG